MFASIGAWILSNILKKVSLKTIGDVASRLAGTDDGSLRLAEINATTQVAMKKEDTAQLGAILSARGAAQQAKMNWPVFWVIITVMIGAPAWQIWGVTLYNTFWHANGIWPQPWNIAAYPPSVAPWVQASIDWLYDPLGAPSGVGAALIAGKLTGGRR